MKKKNYIIQYQCLDKNGKVLQEGKIRAKNKISSFEAQCSFEEFLKKKHLTFGRLIVQSCKEESPLAGIFDNIFGKDKHPFK